MIATYLPWVLSVITLLSMHLAGKCNIHAWSLGVVNQAFWLVWIVASGTWGLLPLTVALTYVYARNYMKWKKL